MRKAVLGNTKLGIVGEVAKALSLAIENTELEYNHPLIQQLLKSAKEVIADIIED